MILCPKYYCNRITDITVDYLKENNIEALILDVDNTLLDLDLKIVEGLENWYENIKSNGIKAYIVSNSNKINKIKLISDKLEIPYIMFATKPLKRGLKKAQKALEIENSNNIAVIGDQIFTDVLGANRCKMFSILVEPLDEKDIWITRLNRPLQNFIKNKFIKNK